MLLGRGEDGGDYENDRRIFTKIVALTDSADSLAPVLQIRNSLRVC